MDKIRSGADVAGKWFRTAAALVQAKTAEGVDAAKNTELGKKITPGIEKARDATVAGFDYTKAKAGEGLAATRRASAAAVDAVKPAVTSVSEKVSTTVQPGLDTLKPGLETVRTGAVEGVAVVRETAVRSWSFLARRVSEATGLQVPGAGEVADTAAVGESSAVEPPMPPRRESIPDPGAEAEASEAAAAAAAAATAADSSATGVVGDADAAEAADWTDE